MKNNFLKRIFATGLALCMVFSVMPKYSLSSRAAEESENLALSATLSTDNELTEGGKNGFKKLNDGNLNEAFYRIYNGDGLTYTKEAIKGKEFYQYTWTNPISVNQVRMSVVAAPNVAPTAWHVEVLEENATDWTYVSYISGVQWKSSDASVVETESLNFATQKNIKGLRVYIDDWNVKWGDKQYAITEIEVYNDPSVEITEMEGKNLAPSAKVSTSVVKEAFTETYLKRLNDGILNNNSNAIYRSGTIAEIAGKDYYQFDWSRPISVNRVDLVVVQGINQGPTAWRVQVTKNGTDWSEVAKVTGVQWKSSDASVVETEKLTFDLQENITGLRVYIDSTNLKWGGYGIQEIEIYNIANLALSATISTDNNLTEGGKSGFKKLNDGNLNEAFYRIYDGDGLTYTKEAIKGKEFYQYTWTNPISVNQVRMSVVAALNVAPTAWHVEVLEENATDWTYVSYVSGVQWKSGSSDNVETESLTFAMQKNIKGLRVYIDDWNIGWGDKQYAISEIEVYNAPSAEITEMKVKNLAPSATVSASSDVPDKTKETLSRLNDNDFDSKNTLFRSVSDTAVTGTVNDYYQFNWTSAVTVNQVDLTVTQGLQEGPTAWCVQVTKDGTTWTEVAKVTDVQWKYGNSDVQAETKKLTFELQEDITGLRVYIDEAHLVYKGYGIQEIEVYNNPVSLNGCTATLDGTINMNFLLNLNLTESERTNAATYMCFTIPGEGEQRVLSSGKETNGYKFTCKVPAKRMTDKITAKFYVKGQLYPETFEYSVEEYAKTIANASTANYSEQARELAKAMLHYGAYSQLYFNYNTSQLANANLSALDLSGVNDSSFQTFVTGNETNLTGFGTNKGSSLILESETTLKLYFEPAEGVDAKDLTFKRNGETLETSECISNGEAWVCILVSNIAAHELGDTIEITVSNGSTSGTLKYSALTYGYNVLKNATSKDSLKNLVKALYLYYRAAVDYKGAQRTGYVLDWSDEFNGATLSSESWLTQHQPHRSSSAVASTAKYTVNDGSLKLRIEEDSVNFYNGAAGGFRISGIQTYEKNGLHIGEDVTLVAPFNGYTTQYGYFEMRCKMPSCGGGGVAAWWLVGTQDDAQMDGSGSTQDAEIDIIETKYAQTGYYSPKLHPWNDTTLKEFTVVDSSQPEGVKLDSKADYINEWHTYAMNWTPSGLVFYVDGVERARTNQSPQYEMAMIVSMYAHNDPEYWGGIANDTYPKEWEIDYIRVYKDVNGYPGGVTKPATPAVKEETISAQTYTGNGDPAETLHITDLARNATLTVSANASQESASEANINSSNFGAGWSSKDNPPYGAEFVFTWAEAQTVDALNLYSRFSADQGITGIELWTTTNGSDWKKDDSYKIEWQDKTGNLEYATIPVKNGNNIKGLKIVVKAANLTWKHYTINKIHIYKNQ